MVGWDDYRCLEDAMKPCEGAGRASDHFSAQAFPSDGHHRGGLVGGCGWK